MGDLQYGDADGEYSHDGSEAVCSQRAAALSAVSDDLSDRRLCVCICKIHPGKKRDQGL